MKLVYGNVPVKSLNLNYFERSTNDCDMIASDLQSGKTGVAKGRKVTGTGKSFEFAMYGSWMTNLPVAIPSIINTIQISSINYPIRTIIPVHDTNSLDFSVSQTIAEIVIDGEIYPLVVSVQNGMLTVVCDHTINIVLFYGKDRYI